MMILKYEREQVVEYGRKLAESGLCPGTSGNLSVLDADSGYMAITPSGMDYLSLEPKDITVLDLYGNVIDGNRKPSSELALHTAFYKAKPHIRSVVHTHSIYCTSFAVLAMPIKAVHFIIGSAHVSEVPCAPYVLFGTEELAEKAVKCAGSSDAVLLQNHGIVCCGTDAPSAFSLAMNMEYAAELQYRAMCIGTPTYISDNEMSKVLEKFKGYGQQ